jgi:hypothetical protein
MGVLFLLRGSAEHPYAREVSIAWIALQPTPFLPLERYRPRTSNDFSVAYACAVRMPCQTEPSPCGTPGLSESSLDHDAQGLMRQEATSYLVRPSCDRIERGRPTATALEFAWRDHAHTRNQLRGDCRYEARKPRLPSWSFAAPICRRPVWITYFCLDDDFGAGTLAPAFRASERPIAIACLRLVTFLPEPPLLIVPRFCSSITFLTLA